MKRKAETFFNGIGYYLTILFCLAVIVLSAVYAKRDDERRALTAPITAENGEMLSDVLFGETTPPPLEAYAPATKSGEIAADYSESPVYFPSVGLWRAHRAVDYAVSAGEDVLSIRSGHITAIDGDALSVRHADGSVSTYVGVESISFHTGDAVRQGEALGKATGRVPGEGEGILHVSVLSSGGAPVRIDQ